MTIEQVFDLTDWKELRRQKQYLVELRRMTCLRLMSSIIAAHMEDEKEPISKVNHLDGNPLNNNLDNLEITNK